jgi:hypothetical protein
VARLLFHSLCAAVAAASVGTSARADQPSGAEDPPHLRLAQRIGADGAGQPTVTLQVDRDAFLVVLEVGVDGRLRLVHPASPSDAPMVAAGTSVPVRLPSFAAQGFDASTGMPSAAVRTMVPEPFVVAFASDVGAKLDLFGAGDGGWRYQFVVDAALTPPVLAEQLAARLFEAGVPFSVETAVLSPPLTSAAAFRLAQQYVQCGAVLEGGVAGVVDPSTRWRLLDLFAFVRMPGERSPWGSTDVRERYAMSDEAALLSTPVIARTQPCPAELRFSRVWEGNRAPRQRAARQGDLVLDGVVWARESVGRGDGAAARDAQRAAATARRDADFARRTQGWGTAGVFEVRVGAPAGPTRQP